MNDVCVVCTEEITDTSDQWGCQTCSLICHTHCVQKWVTFASSASCPQCRDHVQLHTVFKKEELLFMFFMLSVVPNEQVIDSNS